MCLLLQQVSSAPRPLRTNGGNASKLCRADGSLTQVSGIAASAVAQELGDMDDGDDGLGVGGNELQQWSIPGEFFVAQIGDPSDRQGGMLVTCRMIGLVSRRRSESEDVHRVQRERQNKK